MHLRNPEYQAAAVTLRDYSETSAITTKCLDACCLVSHELRGPGILYVIHFVFALPSRQCPVSTVVFLVL